VVLCLLEGRSSRTAHQAKRPSHPSQRVCVPVLLDGFTLVRWNWTRTDLNSWMGKYLKAGIVQMK
jgi:hypothetical protein